MYYLLKDQQIRLMDGHKIPSADEIQDKKYCKWHNSYSHNASNCLVFQQAIQKALKEGRIKLANKSISKMIVDIDLFPSIDNIMISCSPSKKKRRAIWQSKQVEVQGSTS